MLPLKRKWEDQEEALDVDKILVKVKKTEYPDVHYLNVLSLKNICVKCFRISIVIVSAELITDYLNT